MQKWLNKNIIALSFASLFDDFGYELAIAILPAFLISINSSVATFGLIVGITNAFSFLKIIAGKLSDEKNSRKPFTSLGYAINSMSFFILPFAQNWITVFIAWIISGIGKNIREPARNALLIESSEPKYYGRIFGFHRAIDSIGAILGPTLGLVIISYVTFKYIFLISFIASLVALCTIIFIVTETKKHINLTDTINLFNLKKAPKQFKLYLITSGIFCLGNFANSLLIFRTIELLKILDYNTLAAEKYAIFLYIIYNISYTFFSLPAGYLADKFGTKNILALGYLLTTIVSAGFMFNINLLCITTLFILAGIAATITNSLSKSLIANMLHTKYHGSGFGIYSTITSFAFMLANFTVSFLWSKISPIHGFGFSAILCLFGTILFFSFVNNSE